MDVWNGICGAVGGLAPIIAVFCKVTDKLVTLSQPNEPTTLRELNLKVVSLDIDLRELEGQVAALAFEQRREEALALARAIDQERAHLQAAIDIAVDHPNDIAAEAQALGAAQALAKPTFYTLPGRTVGAADRFDPRAALPSFVVAVDGWLAIRAAAKVPATPTSRQNTAEFAARLNQLTAQMRASVHCEEVFHNFERFNCPRPKPPRIRRPGDPEPEPTPECLPSAACNHRLSCTDEMEDQTSATGTTTDGTCPGSTTANAQRNRATRLADYELEKFEAIAKLWLSMAQ
jgi:hypothetical protein